MELRLLPHFVDDPLRAMKKAFETFYDNTAATIPALLLLTFPYLILFVHSNYGNFLTIITIMIISPIVLSGLMWQLVIGTTWKTVHTDFIDGLKKNYVRLGTAYLLIAFVGLILLQVFVVLLAQLIGFDGSEPIIAMSESMQSTLFLVYFFALVIGATVLLSIFQFFDVIIVAEDTPVLESFKKSYYVFKESPMNVFTYMSIRGFVLLLTLGSPVLLFGIAGDDVFIQITAVLATLILFPISVVIGVAYHIQYYDVRTEYIDFSNYKDKNDDESGDGEEKDGFLKSALQSLKSLKTNHNS